MDEEEAGESGGDAEPAAAAAAAADRSTAVLSDASPLATDGILLWLGELRPPAWGPSVRRTAIGTSLKADSVDEEKFGEPPAAGTAAAALEDA